MAGQSSSYRSDEQLAAILIETGNWVIRGRQGQSLGAGSSLGRALLLSVDDPRAREALHDSIEAIEARLARSVRGDNQ